MFCKSAAECLQNRCNYLQKCKWAAAGRCRVIESRVEHDAWSARTPAAAQLANEVIHKCRESPHLFSPRLSFCLQKSANPCRRLETRQLQSERRNYNTTVTKAVSREQTNAHVFPRQGCQTLTPTNNSNEKRPRTLSLRFSFTGVLCCQRHKYLRVQLSAMMLLKMWRSAGSCWLLCCSIHLLLKEVLWVKQQQVDSDGLSLVHCSPWAQHRPNGRAESEPTLWWFFWIVSAGVPLTNRLLFGFSQKLQSCQCIIVLTFIPFVFTFDHLKQHRALFIFFILQR